MKTFTRIFFIFSFFFLAFGVTTLQSQISVQGLVSENEGVAAWDADGTGPEPQGNGHSSFLYYVASVDYVNPSSTSGGHVMTLGSDFPLFAQSLANNGFTPGQVKLKMGLSSLGDDVQGIDWFYLNSDNYLNFYPLSLSLTLNDEPMIEGMANYFLFQYGSSTGFQWVCKSNFFVPADASGASSAPVQEVAAAFLQDVASQELHMKVNTFGSQVPFAGNGRAGAYFSYNGTLEKGLPEIPLLGLPANNEGGAGWDADGTGPEPFGNGHSNFVYYTASVDYINSSPDAALCHFLDVENGFQNTILQLQNRGYEIGDLKIKMGLASLGPDIENEDWGVENGHSWLNFYNNALIFELNGEPILQILCDTNKMVQMGTYYVTGSSIGKVYDISENAPADAQFVAQSFMKDIGTHYLKLDIRHLSFTGTFGGNGRTGAYYQLGEASLIGLHQQATFIEAGTLQGNLSLAGSPYYIEGHQLIENGQTLTIDPGVRIGIRGPYHFTMKGCVKAQGTANNIITFTSSNPNIWWDGFDFDGVTATNDSSRFDHCLFQYSHAQGSEAFNSGGAIAVKNFDKFSILNSTFRKNMADVYSAVYYPCGGAIGLWNSGGMIQKCIFYENHADYFGGAIMAYLNCHPVVSNCLFYNNTAQRGGAISFYENGGGYLINNTIADNEAELYGGAIYFYGQALTTIVNNILWGNEATTSGNQIHFYNMTNPGFYYNDIQGGQAGFSGGFNGDYLFNIEDDPQFGTNPEFPPYYPSDESTCLDAGTPDTSAWYYPEYLPQTCLFGNPRISGSGIDMGAYENPYTGINQQATYLECLTIYPNPFNENLTININLTPASTVTIELTNTLGETVVVFNLGDLNPAGNNFAIPTSSLPAGVYFCRMQLDNKVFTHKLMKTK